MIWLILQVRYSLKHRTLRHILKQETHRARCHVRQLKHREYTIQADWYVLKRFKIIFLVVVTYSPRLTPTRKLKWFLGWNSQGIDPILVYFGFRKLYKLNYSNESFIEWKIPKSSEFSLAITNNGFALSVWRKVFESIPMLGKSLYWKSPNALETAKSPATRPISTLQPAALILSVSCSSDGRWSFVANLS